MILNYPGGAIDQMTRTSQDNLERWAQISLWTVAALMFIAGVLEILRPRLFEAAIEAAALILLLFFLLFLEKRLKIRIPPLLKILISLLLLVSLVLGRFFSLYKSLPGFDKSQHFLYGLFFAIFGFVLFYRLNPHQQKLTVSPMTVALFAVCFALLLGFGWEIYEFASDRLFDSNMQSWKQSLASGLIDTMLDLVVDMAGSVLVAWFAIRRLKRDSEAFYQQFISGFMPDRQNEAA